MLPYAKVFFLHYTHSIHLCSGIYIFQMVTQAQKYKNQF